MPAVPANDDEKPGTARIVAAIILSLLAVASIVVALTQAGGQHSLRMLGGVLVGIAFATGAWFALRYQSLALEEAREAERAALAELGRPAVGDVEGAAPAEAARTEAARTEAARTEAAPAEAGDPAEASQSVGTAGS